MNGRINFVNLFLFAIVAFGGVTIYTFAPYYWDAKVMEEITKVVALEYGSFSKEKAKTKLKRELEEREIPDYIQETDCQFTEQRKERTVTCNWAVEVYWPFQSKYSRVLYFETTETADGQGLL